MKKYKNIFISDLHLSIKDTVTLQKFKDFCDNYGRYTENLYILGDLFEYWIGDNCIESWHKDIANILNNLASNNTNIYFMAGNRDFLLSKKFAKLANIKILKDPYIININNTKIILTHGDRFCTNDKSYQAYRKVAQNFITKKILNVTPKFIKLKLVDLLKRENNNNHVKTKSKIDLIKYDVVKKTIAKAMEKYESLTVIHGHTHKPRIHSNKVKVNNKYKFSKRYVLGDWQAEKAIILVQKKDSIKLEAI